MKDNLNLEHKKFVTNFFDKKNIRIKEGDYIKITETKKINNHYWDGYESRMKINCEPYKEWDVTGTVIYLVQWNGATLVAKRVKEIGDPHPSLSVGSRYLNLAFDSKKFEIIGNINDNFDIDNYA